MEDVKKENCRRLWHSIEMGEVRKYLIVYLVLWPIAYALAAGRFQDPAAKGFMIIMSAVVVLPFFLFYLIRMIRILLHAEEYIFCETELTKPHTSFNHRMFYFSVVIRNEEGKVFMTDTHAIFSARSLFCLQMEDYVNRAVTVAYNKVTGMVVVIG